MEARIDSVGRIVLPKPLRDRLGLKAGTTVDVSLYGRGLQVIPGERTARIEQHGSRTLAVSDTVVTDEDVFRLIDENRR